MSSKYESKRPLPHKSKSRKGLIEARRASRRQMKQRERRQRNG